MIQMGGREVASPRHAFKNRSFLTEGRIFFLSVLILIGIPLIIVKTSMNHYPPEIQIAQQAILALASGQDEADG